MIKSITTEVDVDVDVNIDEFSTYELIDEVLSRLKYNKVSKEVKQKLRNALHSESNIKIETIDDEMKYDYIGKIWRKYTLAEIENKLPE